MSSEERSAIEPRVIVPSTISIGSCRNAMLVAPRRRMLGAEAGSPDGWISWTPETRPSIPPAAAGPDERIPAERIVRENEIGDLAARAERDGSSGGEAARRAGDQRDRSAVRPWLRDGDGVAAVGGGGRPVGRKFPDDHLRPAERRAGRVGNPPRDRPLGRGSADSQEECE